MGKLIGATKDEQQLSYYKYYESGLVDIPAEKLELTKAPQPVGRGIPFDQKDDFILRPQDKNYCYIGFGENPDGTAYATNSTFFPGGTPEMLEWWFVWQGLGPDLRYRLWDPEDHYWSKIGEVEHALDEKLTIRERLWNTTHHVLENIGMGPMRVDLRFINPVEFGFSKDLVYREGCDAIVSAGGVPSCVCHKARKVEGGIMVDTYFWVGYYVDSENKIHKLDPKQSPFPLIAAAQCLYSHNLREMGKLASVLVDLYNDEKGKEAL